MKSISQKNDETEYVSFPNMLHNTRWLQFWILKWLLEYTEGYSSLF